ncbi:MAG: gliding motility-associated ABC transporter permease subunit GldF [Hyphomicrobiales bacterium]
MWALFKKEISSFFSSLIGYVTIGVFLLVNSLFLWVFQVDMNILDYGYANLDGLFILGPFVFLFLIPAITMKSFSEERKTGTIELLVTRPITDYQIVFAKFLGGLVIVFFSLLPTLIYYISVYRLGYPVGNIDTGATWGSYIGMLLLGASFVSIGLFSSSISNNQIVAFILAICISAFLYLGFQFVYSFDLFGKIDLFIKELGMSAHYSSLSRGVVDTRDILYFLSIIAVFLSLSKISIASRKW